MGGYVARQKREAALYDRKGPAAKGASCAPAKLTYRTMTLGHSLSAKPILLKSSPIPLIFFPICKKEHSNHPACNAFGEFQLRVLFMTIAFKQTAVFMGPVPQRSSSRTQRGQDVNEEGVLASLHHWDMPEFVHLEQGVMYQAVWGFRPYLAASCGMLGIAVGVKLSPSQYPVSQEGLALVQMLLSGEFSSHKSIHRFIQSLGEGLQDSIGLEGPVSAQYCTRNQVFKTWARGHWSSL